MEFITKINFFIVVALLIVVSIQDVLYRVISNYNVVLIAMTLCSFIILSGKLPNLPLSLAVLCVGFLLFITDIIGAGDVKLISVLTLSFNLTYLYQFLLMTAMFGGGVALVGLLFFRKNVVQKGIPYGVAISLAFIFTHL